MATYSEVEEELLAQQEEEEERARALEEQKQLDRQQSGVNRVQDAAKELAKDYAKKAVKNVAKEQAAAAASAAGSAIASSAPVWGPILGVLAIIVLVVGLGFYVLITMVSYCNSGGLTGFLAKLGSRGAELIGTVPTDICAGLKIDTTQFAGGAAGGGGASGSFEPTDLVTLVGLVPVDGSTSDPRVRQCMATRVQQIFSQAQAQGISITITSAFRSGGTTAGGGVSAHSRGEAVDIALRDPTVPVHGNDPRIQQLLSIARAAGFNPPQGDTLDEYSNPAENATGGHVHIEFNIPSSGSYCDGTAA